jgi:hypothetical protein
VQPYLISSDTSIEPALKSAALLIPTHFSTYLSSDLGACVDVQPTPEAPHAGLLAFSGALAAVLGRDDSLTVFVGKRRSMWWYAAALAAAIELLDLREYGNFYFYGPRSGETTLESLGTRPPRPYRSDREYYLFVDGVVKGPYGLIDLKGLAHSRAVSARTQVYVGEGWKSLGDVDEVYSTRSWAVALAFSMLLGWLGIDRFYLGKIGSGIVKLLTVGGLGAWWLLDFLLTVFHAVNDASGKPLR